MEPTPVDVSPAASPSYRGTRGGPAAPPRAAAALAGGRLGRTALDLLRRAPLNLRRHVVRAVWRFVVLVIGDLAAHELQLADPNLLFVNDVDPALAAVTRRRIVAELAAEGAAVLAGHFRGVGRFEPAGKGFRWSVE